VQKTLSAAILSVAIATAMPAFGAASGQMHVSVEVIARTILTVDSQPSSVQVTTADITRGYIDLPQAIAFHVRSNARDGYSLQFQPVSGPFTTAVLSWSNAVATVGADASWMAQPYQRGITTGSMSVHLTLAPGTTPGTYAWPVALGADSR
jgi:hypothetical protein